jgi:hypothetical protein
MLSTYLVDPREPLATLVDSHSMPNRPSHPQPQRCSADPYRDRTRATPQPRRTKENSHV